VKKISKTGERSYNEGLSAREVTLLARWERDRLQAVTLAELAREFGIERARYIARSLVRKQVLQRLQRGSFLIRPMRALSRPSTRSTAALTATLLRNEPYYLGGLWAVSTHRLSEQRYASICDAFVRRRLAARRLGPGRVRFHQRSLAKLEYGVEQLRIEDTEVRVSDLERTVLDALDHPRLFGGLERSMELLMTHLKKLDARKLVDYAVKGSRSSTCQRLGVVLERNGVSPRSLAALHRKARRTRSVLSLFPDGGRQGPLNLRWNVVENRP
jgi:predicted transcriptional regulator of viral defense system